MRHKALGNQEELHTSGDDALLVHVGDLFHSVIYRKCDYSCFQGIFHHGMFVARCFVAGFSASLALQRFSKHVKYLNSIFCCELL